MPKLKTASLVLGLVLSPTAKAEPIDFFKQMAGCFAVTYTYVEDGASDAFFKPVFEKADLSEINEVVHIQRTLIVGEEAQDHWREEWRLLEAPRQLWEQTVYGPFGDFRYRCSGVIEGGAWRCDAPASPKPRRDKDRPYKTLDRENTLRVNGQRWIHMQKNTKRMADGSFYALELGWNQYERQSDKDCLLARNSKASTGEAP